MKHALTLAVVALLLASPGWAKKQRRKKTQPGGGFGGFGPTVAFVDFDALNAELAGNGFDELGSMHWMFGGGGYAHIGRVVLGGSGWGGTQSVSSDDRLLRVNIAGGMFEAGYALLNLKHLIVIPMLGIGGNGYTLTVESLEYPGSFGEFLEGPGPTSSVGFSGFTLTPELVIDLPVKFIGLQLRGGYAYTPETPEWKFPGGGALARGPEVAAGHPFASLQIIFGGYNRKGKRG